MAEYYLPDGSGPYFTDDVGTIPSGSEVVQLGSEGTTTINVVTDVRINGTQLEIQKTTVSVSSVGATGSWEDLGPIDQP